MIFKQDTEKNELNLIFTETDEVGTVKLVEDFCDGMAWFLSCLRREWAVSLKMQRY